VVFELLSNIFTVNGFCSANGFSVSESDIQVVFKVKKYSEILRATLGIGLKREGLVQVPFSAVCLS